LDSLFERGMMAFNYLNKYARLMQYDYKEREVVRQPEREFEFGKGKISAYSCALLGCLSLISVFAYLYPSYLTTTDMRAVYDGEQLQIILKYGMWSALFFGVVALFYNGSKKLALIGLSTTLLAFALGGYTIEVSPVESKNFSLGVDWLALSLLGHVLFFTSLEKVFPKYRDQVILREEWKLDLVYFVINHLLITTFILLSNYAIHGLQWAMSLPLQEYIQSLPFFVQFIIAVLIADFVFYWQHRVFHKVKILWPFHAVHHSVETMDWLAGSRAHIVHSIVERVLVVSGLHLVGVEKEVLDAYIIFAAIQSITNHSNLGIPWGPIKYILVTPQYHHWHHSSERPALDTNFGAHTTIFDRMFGSYHFPEDHWPAHYGTTKRLPRTFFSQLAHPFNADGYELKPRQVKKEKLVKIGFFIHSAKKKGKTAAQISGSLTLMGWPADAIDQAFEFASKNKPTV